MSERWMPKNLEIYWSVIDTTPMRFAWQGNPLEIARWEAGNVFKTHDQALIASINIKSLLLSLHEEQPVAECNQLPKLTAEVFDRPDCPAWAKYAAVNADGLVRVFLNKPSHQYRMYWYDPDSWWEQGLHSVKYDASDWQNSLIERPEKETELPEWCKVGEIVYSVVFEKYMRITKINNKDLDTVWLKDESYSYTLHLENIKQARIRPWTAREAIGKTICWRGDYSFQENMAIINAVDCDGDLMGDLIGNTNLKDLVRECFYQLDGSPCGVLEHLENGEWVE